MVGFDVGDLVGSVVEFDVGSSSSQFSKQVATPVSKMQERALPSQFSRQAVRQASSGVAPSLLPGHSPGVHPSFSL